MKKVFFSAALLFGLALAGQAQNTTTPAPQENKNAPEFQFEEETHDFGNIPQGTPVTCTFNFKNIGKEPLTISNVSKSCGCTTPEWTKEPIQPGKSGYVKATYNAAAAGSFTKTLTVSSNAKTPTKVLTIKGFVQSGGQQQNTPPPPPPGPQPGPAPKN